METAIFLKYNAGLHALPIRVQVLKAKRTVPKVPTIKAHFRLRLYTDEVLGPLRLLLLPFNQAFRAQAGPSRTSSS